MIDFSKCKTTKDYEQVLLNKWKTWKPILKQICDSFASNKAD